MFSTANTFNSSTISKAIIFLNGGKNTEQVENTNQLQIDKIIKAFNDNPQRVQPDKIINAFNDNPQRVQTDVPKRKTFSINNVNEVWTTYLGSTPEAICPLCESNRMLRDDRSTWEMSHVIAHADGGSCDLSNIRPLCFDCNRGMGKKHLRTYAIERYPERYYSMFRTLKLPM